MTIKTYQLLLRGEKKTKASRNEKKKKTKASRNEKYQMCFTADKT